MRALTLDSIWGIAMSTEFYPHPFDQHAVELCNSASRYIRILSPTLDRDVFDNMELRDALSKLARRGRHSDIRILVNDSRPIVEHGHRLLTLAQRIPSLIHIQKLSDHPQMNDDTMVIRDSDGLLFKPAGSDHQGFYEPESKARVMTYVERFDALWERSSPDINLRQMQI
jgi:hypothetical protein